jgi:hypothetical protein
MFPADLSHANPHPDRQIVAGFSTYERRAGVLDDGLKAFQIHYKNNSCSGNKYVGYCPFSHIK